MRTRDIRTISLLAGGIALGAAGLGSTAALVQSTQIVQFCTSCHVMSGVAEEWRKSPHGVNTHGFTVRCVDCHIDPGMVALARSKVASLHKELLPWLLGTRSPDQIEARRSELAQGVWAHLRESDSAPCRRCHGFSEAVLDGGSDDCR